MSDEVDNQEDITRFYFNRKNFRANNTIKHNEFMPPSSGRLSVYRTSDFTSEEIWEIGKCYVEPGRGKPIVGRGILKAHHITDIELVINPTIDPHPKHANVEGWALDTEKDRVKALKLAAEANSIKI